MMLHPSLVFCSSDSTVCRLYDFQISVMYLIKYAPELSESVRIGFESQQNQREIKTGHKLIDNLYLALVKKFDA